MSTNKDALDNGGLNGSKLLKIFNGRQEDWAMWREKFEAMLDMVEVLDVLLPGTAKPTGGDDLVKWNKSSRSVYSRLVLYTSGTPLGIVKQHHKDRDGVKAWTALVDKYEQKGEVKISALHEQLITAVMYNGEDPEEFFLRLEELQRQLKELNVTVEDSMLKGIVTAKMPEEYMSLRAVIDTMPDLKYDGLKNHMRAFYMRNKMSLDHIVQERAMVAVRANGRFNGQCFKCGRHGHKKNKCLEGDDEEQLRCGYCNKIGHHEKDCWSKKKKGESTHLAMETLAF